MKLRFFAKTIIVALVSLIFMCIAGCGGKFTITFYANGGNLVSGKETQRVISADEIVFPEYEKTGYDFVGWSKEKDDINSDCDIYANWTPKVFTITFDVDEYIAPIAIAYDSEVGALPTAEKEGFYFVGWYYDNNGTEEELREGDIWNIAEDVTVYAKWSQLDKVYSIALENIDPENPELKEYINYNTAFIKLLPKKSKTGYNFLGWYQKGGDETKLVSSIEKRVFDAKAYVAKWETKTYQVEFREYLGGTNYILNKKMSIKYNETIDSLPRTKWDLKGSTFNGWLLENDGSLIAMSAGLAWRWDFDTDDIVVIRDSWTKNIYTLTLDADGFSVDNLSFNFIFDTEISGLPVLTKTDTVYGAVPFLGWFIDNEKIAEKWIYGENKTATAKWETETYNIYYDTEKEPSSFYMGTVPTLDIPQKEGYAFEGWYLDDSYTTAVQFNKPLNKTDLEYTGSEYKINLYAKWSLTERTYIITLENSDPEKPEIKDYISHNTLYKTQLPTKTKTGYNFIGWYEKGDDEMNIISSIESGVYKEKTYVGKWENKEYQVEFREYIDEENYTVKETVVFKYNEVISREQMPIPTDREGCKFNGWNLLYNGNLILFSAGLTWRWDTDSNETLIAKDSWSKNAYTLLLDANGGQVDVSSFKVVFDTEISGLPIPTKTDGVRGKVPFLGWFVGDEKIAGKWIYTENKTATAKWETETYNIYYDTETEPSSFYMGTAPILKVPEKDGYIFEGWYLDNSLTTVAQLDKPLNKTDFEYTGSEYKINLYAKWIKNEYKVNFVLKWATYVDGELQTHFVTVDGKDTYAPTQVKYGETLGSYLPTGSRVKVDDANAVYFAGWIYVVNGKYYKVKENTVFSDQTLTGITGREITIYANIESMWSPSA
ncbi:MAG: InlB B-repeat-containing protein [Clostridia bacterium]|nr:InlB B-repeat-containing protein [Clostridia bacterium]